MIEMKITKRQASDAPVKVAEDTTGIKPATPKDKKLIARDALELWYSLGRCPRIDRP
jgi:hypothetical protein